jgi:outer membrane murein-binding lipoprotein Lpp
MSRKCPVCGEAMNPMSQYAACQCNNTGCAAFTGVKGDQLTIMDNDVTYADRLAARVAELEANYSLLSDDYKQAELSNQILRAKLSDLQVSYDMSIKDRMDSFTELAAAKEENARLNKEIDEMRKDRW